MLTLFLFVGVVCWDFTSWQYLRSYQCNFMVLPNDQCALLIRPPRSVLTLTCTSKFVYIVVIPQC